MAAWDRKTGETAKAYSHFTVYRDMGVDRTLAKVGQALGFSTAYAEQLSDKYNWVERCDQWDAHLQSVHDRALLTEAAKRGRARVKAFEKLLFKSEEALDLVDLERANLGQIGASMKAAAEGLRLEDNLATQNVTMEMNDVRTVLSRLPPEVRSTLLRALGEYSDASRHRQLVGGVPGRSPFEE